MAKTTAEAKRGTLGQRKRECQALAIQQIMQARPLEVVRATAQILKWKPRRERPIKDEQFIAMLQVKTGKREEPVKPLSPAQPWDDQMRVQVQVTLLEAIQEMGSRKAPGRDGIPAELLQRMNHASVTLLGRVLEDTHKKRGSCHSSGHKRRSK